MSFSAPGVALSEGQAQISMIYALGAQCLASVSYAVAATDLSITRPAPPERRMTLPIQNRRLEVTE